MVLSGPSLIVFLVLPTYGSDIQSSGKEKAHKHKHKQIFPVIAWVGGGGAYRPGGQGTFMCCVRNPQNINWVHA